MSEKVPQGQGFDPEQPLPRGKHDWEKLNVEFTIFNLVIRLSISLLRVLLICRPFKMCMGFWLDGMTQSRLYCLPFPSFVPPPGKLLQVSIHSSVVGLKTTFLHLEPRANRQKSAFSGNVPSGGKAFQVDSFPFSWFFGKVKSCINSRLN